MDQSVGRIVAKAATSEVEAEEARRFCDPMHDNFAFRSDVLTGLSVRPRMIPPRWFYDTRGSELFELITRLPEYYPSRTERRLIEQHAVKLPSDGYRPHRGGIRIGVILKDAVVAHCCIPLPPTCLSTSQANSCARQPRLSQVIFPKSLSHLWKRTLAAQSRSHLSPVRLHASGSFQVRRSATQHRLRPLTCFVRSADIKRRFHALVGHRPRQGRTVAHSGL